jgi:hypothetical protein
MPGGTASRNVVGGSHKVALYLWESPRSQVAQAAVFGLRPLVLYARYPRK